MTTTLNVVLSVILALTVGIWGVALSTVVTDLAALAIIAPRLVAPIAGVTSARPGPSARPPAAHGRARRRPGARAARHVPFLRITSGSSPLPGALWVVACGAALWRFGIAPSDRAAVRREFFSGRARAAEAIDQV